MGRSVGVPVSRDRAGPADAACCPQRAYCGQCSERIWGLARQGYRCVNCKLLVHKRCHVLVPLTCRRHMVSAGWGGPQARIPADPCPQRLMSTLTLTAQSPVSVGSQYCPCS